MIALFWNIQGAWPGAPRERVRNQIDFIAEYDDQPDILFFQEVSRYRTEIREYLAEIGYHTIEDTLDWASELGDSTVQPHQDISHTNGNLTAVRGEAGLTWKPLDILGEDFDDVDVKNLNTHYPEKILVTDYEVEGQTIECWNVRAVPGSMKGEEKIKILETVFQRIVDSEERLRLLAGDFNTPDEELCDGQAITHIQDKDPRIRHRWRNAELNILKGLGHAGIIDTFRAIHGFGELDVLDVSHATRTDDPLDVPEGGS
ncbi:endonuclease/exonuclease/phosphatase family protein [Natronosalvus halobius]|uniref:endonuclease/exonuclease/phosphatase family protein n=1 Tax=Natronosalvus halobius TaxID=2953746 RepID=UPI0020A13295|nr:endonuclease/exonuclease/phosphatase family protein [Natronosalvus halobius]USZ73519.1 hypothetical protein NGM15_17805 [Natronosalvus halobius]